MTNKNLARLTIGVLALWLAAGTAMTAGLHERFDTLGLGVGLGGYDPVAYFPEGGGAPAKGFVQRDYQHNGVTYRFASDENRDRFARNPEKYLPAFNGWCAWAMAELNAKVDIEPTSFVVRNDKLYVFYDHNDLNTRELWLKDPDGMIARATSNWKQQAR